jgi:hypothetical protein
MQQYVFQPNWPSSGVAVFGIKELIAMFSRSSPFYPDLDFFENIGSISGARGSIVVKALCYKPEGRGFETR